MKEVVIVKTGGTNFASVEDALHRIGCKVFYAENEKDIINAEKILLPGVGSMVAAETKIKELKNILINLTQPVLGVCLGMQLLFDKSEEGNINALGILNENVVRFTNDVTVPHMGWNKLIFNDSQNVFITMPAGYVYFTHSYYAPFGIYTKAFCEYGNYKVSAIVQKQNFYGFQFHPERSGKYGEDLLKIFINNT